MPRRSAAARLTEIVEAIEHVSAVLRDVPPWNLVRDDLPALDKARREELARGQDERER